MKAWVNKKYKQKIKRKKSKSKSRGKNSLKENKRCEVKQPSRKQVANVTVLKSPLDTTLYNPALRKINSSLRNSDLANDIAKFVENIRLEGSGTLSGRGRRSRMVSPNPEDEREDLTPGLSDEQVANEMANRAIIHAEQFKANVTAPKGKPTEIPVLSAVSNENDDDFFHITCHVDPSLKEKIERGKYVELEKLLPKDRNATEEKRMELVSKNGLTHFAPVQDKN